MNKLKLFILPLVLPLLLNCGGGGGDKASVAPATEIPTKETGNTTTLFKDNPNSQETAVKIFYNYSLNIDMTEIHLQGEFLFLKITDKYKKALFMGQVVHQDNIKIPLSIVDDSLPLIVELYSESKHDKTISYEVYYE
ncbi:MAG: hypothetical protein HRT53_16350 [Colwellia sp.]|nr:hypothetical protein [Colwellia sp.]